MKTELGFLVETFPEFCERDPPPDLQRLAREWKGYGNVPSSVVDRFEAARRAWNLRRLFRHEA